MTVLVSDVPPRGWTVLPSVETPLETSPTEDMATDG